MKKCFVLLISSLFLFVGSACALSKAPVDVTTMSIEELLDAMDKGYLTSETLVQIYLERIETYDDLFHSIQQLNPDALEQARERDKERDEGKLRGRLHGIPILVKCNIDVYGLATTAGTKSLKDNYPLENATVVQKLLDEGAILLGSTNMSELAFSASNSYSSYGYVRNVFHTDYTPYGSSGGSAVAVAAAFAAASLGTDTNSSVRLPASGAGLVGIRPTFGLISRSGVIPYDIERDTIGILSRNVSDSVLLFNILSGEDLADSATQGVLQTEIALDKENLEGITIGVPMQYVKGSAKETGVTGLTDPEIYAMVEKSIALLEESGAEIVYLDSFVKNSNLTIARTTYAGITMCDSFNEYIKGTTGSIRTFEELAASSGHVQTLTGYVAGCDGHYKEKEVRDTKKTKYRFYVEEVFSTNRLDALLYPTLKNKVYPYRETGNISPGSSLGSVIGFPSITVPMGFASDGFSYGLEFLSVANGEDVLYQVASVYEQENGNMIQNSPLTPSLYVVPSEVEELKELYEKVLSSSSNVGEIEEWLHDVNNYFKNYNSMEDVVAPANALIASYREKGIENKLDSDFVFPYLLRIALFVSLFLSVLIILKNVIRCLH